MKKKAILIIVVTLLLLYIIYDFTSLIKTPLANLTFGKENCTRYSETSTGNHFFEDSAHPAIGLTIMTPWKCNLCWRFEESGTSITPALCDLCTKLTNRCSKCGNLLEK